MTDFKPHDTRHTFASELVRQGVSLRVIADMLGHSSLAMVMRYSHVATEDSRAAVLRLSQFEHGSSLPVVKFFDML